MNIKPLQHAYQRLGWTLTRLAVEANVNPGTVGALLSGKGVQVRSLEAIADALGFKIIVVPKSESVEP